MESNSTNHISIADASISVEDVDNGGSTTPAVAVSAAAGAADSSDKLGFLQGATFADVEVGTEAIYMVDKRNKEAFSRLKSIRGKAVADINMKILRNWAVSLNIQMKKQFNKLKVIKCILVAKSYFERTNGSNNHNLTDESNPAPRNHINNVRFINALAKENVKGLLLQRGAQKSRADLDNGSDPDAPLWEAIVDAYNNRDDDDMLVIRWSITWARAPEPDRFHPINVAKAQTTLKSLSSAYEKAFSNWKKSGWHEGIETKPFHDFVGSTNYLDYLHCLLQETDGLLEVIKCDLPSNVFSEGTPVSNRKRGPSSAKKSNSESLEKIAAAQTVKAKCLAYQTNSEAYCNLELQVQELKERKRRSFKELKEQPEFIDETKSYLKAYLKKIKKRRLETGNKENDDSDEEVTFQQTQDSLATGDSFDEYRQLAESYWECDDLINEKTSEMKILKGGMSAYLSALKEDE